MVKKIKKIKVALDLDGVIIDKPPLVPKKLLEWLFRGGKKDGLHYRFPNTKFEQKIRKLSHFYLFRPLINQNIAFVKEIGQNSNYELHVVSARYSFLEKETKNWLKKRGIDNLFREVHLNLENEQPHLFKEKVLRKIKADIFIDDDNLLADYLVGRLKRIKIFCLTAHGAFCKNAKNISYLEEAFK